MTTTICDAQCPCDLCGRRPASELHDSPRIVGLSWKMCPPCLAPVLMDIHLHDSPVGSTQGRPGYHYWVKASDFALEGDRESAGKWVRCVSVAAQDMITDGKISLVDASRIEKVFGQAIDILYAEGLALAARGE